MSWTKEQQEGIFDQYWRTRTGTCPIDGAVLTFNLAVSFSEYMLIAQCKRCGASLQMNRENDHLRASFRDWTDEEKADLFDAHFREEVLTCPIDGARVASKDNPHADGNLVVLRCVRCGNEHYQTFKYSR